MADRLATILDVVGPVGGAAPGEASGIAPEFRDLPQGQIEVWLSIAALHVGGSVWGAHRSYAHALVTAHLLATLVGPDGLGGTEDGPVASQALGPASVSYATSSASALASGNLSTSSYGRAFEVLRETIKPLASWVSGNSYASLAYLRPRGRFR